MRLQHFRTGAKAIALLGVGATKPVAHVVFVGVGAALVLYGLWQTRRESGLLGTAGFAMLALAATLTPSSAMSTPTNAMHGSLPWNAAEMVGGALYVAAGGMLDYAFWRAFPAHNPGASATAMAAWCSPPAAPVASSPAPSPGWR